MHATRMPRAFENFLASLKIWNASSRAGAMTRPIGPSWSLKGVERVQGKVVERVHGKVVERGHGKVVERGQG